MTVLLLLILGSFGIVLAAERHPATRSLMQKITNAYAPGACRSFILDILILLPLVGLLVKTLSQRVKSRRVAAWFPAIAGTLFLFWGWFIQNTFIASMGLLLYIPFAPGAMLGGKILRWWSVRQTFYATAFCIFFAISCALYLDYFNFSFLASFLGHPKAWNGNHFMWNSGVEIIGLRPWLNTAVPTYKNSWGFWNLLAFVFLGPVYIWVLVDPRTWILHKTYTRLRGLLFGYTEKQTGIYALFFESCRKRR